MNQTSNKLVLIIWNFDFLSSKAWKIFHNWFINQKGVINTPSDVFLLIVMLTLPILWLIGCFFVVKKNILKVIATFFVKLINVFYSQKDLEPERIIIKNIKSDVKEIEEIKTEMESFKPKKASSAGNLRNEITKKISDTKK